MTIEVCREIAARLWCDQEMRHIIMDVPTCERIAQELFQYLNDFKVGDMVVCRWPGTWLNGMIFRISDIGYYMNSSLLSTNLTLLFEATKNGHMVSGCVVVPRKYCKKYSGS